MGRSLPDDAVSPANGSRSAPREQWRADSEQAAASPRTSGGRDERPYLTPAAGAATSRAGRGHGAAPPPFGDDLVDHLRGMGKATRRACADLARRLLAHAPRRSGHRLRMADGAATPSTMNLLDEPYDGEHSDEHLPPERRLAAHGGGAAATR